MRLGGRYLYVHQRHCEHILSLTDVHLLPVFAPAPAPAPALASFATMPPLTEAKEAPAPTFPRCVYSSKMKQRVCGVCDAMSAAWVTYGDPLTPHMPFFFCKECYHMLHYSAPQAALEPQHHSELLYSGFEVFPYERDQL